MVFASFYGCFLSSSKPTRAIAMIIAIVAPTMYIIRSEVVARFAGVVATGDGVAAASSTTKVVSEYDGQYPLVPWNVAMTL